MLRRGWPRGSRRKKFPCRGGESIRRRSTSTLSNRRLDIPYSSPPLPSSVRAYNYRRHANPGTLLARERERESSMTFLPPLFFSPSLLHVWPTRSDTNTRKKARLTAGPAKFLLRSSTPCWRSHGAPLPYDFHVSASGPPKLHDQALYLT